MAMSYRRATKMGYFWTGWLLGVVLTVWIPLTFFGYLDPVKISLKLVDCFPSPSSSILPPASSALNMDLEVDSGGANHSPPSSAQTFARQCITELDPGDLMLLLPIVVFISGLLFLVAKVSCGMLARALSAYIPAYSSVVTYSLLVYLTISIFHTHDIEDYSNHSSSSVREMLSVGCFSGRDTGDGSGSSSSGSGSGSSSATTCIGNTCLGTANQAISLLPPSAAMFAELISSFTTLYTILCALDLIKLDSLGDSISCFPFGFLMICRILILVNSANPL